MNNIELQQFLMQLFRHHEVALQRDEDWLTTDDDFPAIRASWHEADANAFGRLDIDVVLGEDQQIEESYASEGGAGTDCRDALDRFTEGCLPVLLAACWYVTDDRALRLESWDGIAHGWDVFIGPCMMQGTAEATAPADALEPLLAALREEVLAPRMHWVRLFLRRDASGTLAVEALLDNESWPAGDQALAAAAWPVSAEPYSAHAFIMLDVRDY